MHIFLPPLEAMGVISLRNKIAQKGIVIARQERLAPRDIPQSRSLTRYSLAAISEVLAVKFDFSFPLELARVRFPSCGWTSPTGSLLRQ